jgi:hypothetical protein
MFNVVAGISQLMGERITLKEVTEMEWTLG